MKAVWKGQVLASLGRQQFLRLRFYSKSTIRQLALCVRIVVALIKEAPLMRGFVLLGAAKPRRTA